MAGQARAERPRIYAITGARIVTAPGHVIDNGTVILRDGLIEAVGSKLAVPADAEQISAGRNSTVYPAFIDAASGVGLDAAAAPAGASRPAAEPKARGASHELKAVHPEDAVLERVDFSHASLARHRELGFAVAQVLPDKGVFRGESAVLLLRPGSAADLVLRDRAAAVVALETASFMARQYPSSKFGAVATVRQVLLDARRQAQWTARYQASPTTMEPPGFRASDAALSGILGHERPVLWVSLAGLDPGRFANLAREFGLEGGAVLARGLGDHAEDLRGAGMPVLLPLEMPATPDLGDSDAAAEVSLEQLQEGLLAPRLPGVLAASGVKVAFVTLGMKDPRRFSASLAAIVRAGFPPEAALAALTTTPAALLGLSRSLGTLEPGKQANLMVVEGDLFTDKPVIRQLFIAGYRQELKPPPPGGGPAANGSGGRRPEAGAGAPRP